MPPPRETSGLDLLDLPDLPGPSRTHLPDLPEPSFVRQVTDSVT